MCCLVIVFVACLSNAVAARAAEIFAGSDAASVNEAVLEGKIAAGDFEKFENFLRNGEKTNQIYLASPGGDLNEAIKIGLLVRALKLWTIVPSKALTEQKYDSVVARHNLKDPKANYMCASACFFIFVAGVHRSSDDRGPPLLGIHRPSLAKNDLSGLNIGQAATADDRARATIVSYLKLMGVPSKYAEDMYSVPKDRIRWIRYDEFQTDFNGFVSAGRQ